MRTRLFRYVAASLLGGLLAACTSGQTQVVPVTAVNPLTYSTLQFAVGTANIGITATIGLNTVVTFRQTANGALDATLLNQPIITGPPGFVNTGSSTVGGTAAVPGCAPGVGVQTTTGVAQPLGAGTDSGMAVISGSPQPLPAGSLAICTTFGIQGGAFGYGFQPANSTTGAGVSFGRYSLPLYTGAIIVPYIGGPPQFPQVRDGTFPTGFQGYPMGFTDFNLAPVAGTYSLQVIVPTGFVPNTTTPTFGTVTASATLATTVPLPAFPTPTFVPDGAGGGTINATVPAGVTEAYLIVLDRDGICYPGTQSAPAYYTIRTTTTGAQALVLPANLGPTGPGQPSTRTICSGDRYRVYGVGFDYPANGAAYPFSTSPNPTIVGANGQADVTTSALRNGAYP